MKQNKNMIFRRILTIALVLFSQAATADWTPQNELACDDDTPGQFKYYVLSLSWSPEFCRSHPNNHEQQCKQLREFIVHGLWPECGSGSPHRCLAFGPADAIDKEKIYAYMPSDFLIQHEWDTHGTCSGLSRSVYFDLTEKLYKKLNFPRLSGAPTADKIKELFIAINPGLDDDEVYFSCTENGPKKSNHTLDEVRICFDKDSHEFTRCEDVRDTCRNLKKVTISRRK
jgi:ribonuclease T2